MKKKLIMAAILVLSAALLVATSVMGTLAFLASSTAVSNTFTYGDVGIQMFESEVDANGQKTGTTKTSDGNSYQLIPNKTYDKDPTIYVKEGSVPSYLFVKVKNGISTIEKEGNTTIKAQMVANGWQLIKSNAAGEELYIYVGFNGDNSSKATVTQINGAVTAKPVGSANAEHYDLFQTFTISKDATVADYAGAKVTLTAFAIQTEGFTAAENGLEGYQRAWNAIVGRFPFESGTVYTAPASGNTGSNTPASGNTGSGDDANGEQG